MKIIICLIPLQKINRNKVQFVPLRRAVIRYNVGYRKGSVSQMCPGVPAMSDRKNRKTTVKEEEKKDT